MAVWMFLLFMTAASSAHATSVCIIDDPKDCTYTIRCQYHPGSATNINCIHEPNVTFIMYDSSTSTLTPIFFGATNFDARVRHFKAVNSTWTVIDSLSFRYYSRVHSVDLSNNKIRDIRKDAFRNLMYMDRLDLSRNLIDKLQPQCFFLGDTKDPDLSEIDLSYNRLTNLTDALFSNLAKLRTLYLNNNRLSYIADDAFVNSFKALKNLYLQNNFLRGLNTTLVHAKNLEMLNVSYNLLTKLSGYEVNRLTSLKSMNLSHNSISVIKSDCFNQAIALEVLDLSYNKITSTITNVMFVNNNKLKHLNVYNNRITTIEENSFVNTALEYLNLEDNSLTGVIKENLFSGMKAVKYLKVYKQNLVAIENNAFKDMERLLMLNLSKNSIRDIQPRSFNNLDALKIMDLSKNKIPNLLFLNGTLGNLTELNIAENNLSIVPSNAFDSQVMIIKLNLSLNNIFKIEPNSLPLATLQYLHLDGNRINVSVIEETFSPAKALRYLYFNKYDVGKVEKNSFINLPLLALLNLSQNRINVVDSNNFVNMSNTYSLDLSFNNISRLSFPDSNLPNLRSLDISHNCLTDFAHVFLNISGLLYLELSHNNISDIARITFDDTPVINYLSLSHNRISYFNNPQTNVLKALVSLDLSFNHIMYVDLSYYSNIVHASLSYNNISSITNADVHDLNELQSLDISGNRLTKIVPGTFKDIKVLAYLNISDNNLGELRYGCFRGLHKTKIIDISRNNIEDIDVDVFHECGDLMQVIVDYNKLKRFDVERLVTILPKLISISLGGNPVSCKEIVHNIKNVNGTVRQVEVTSIDKVFHEDNVNGIQCGDAAIRTTTERSIEPDKSSVSSVLIFFIVVFLLLAVGGGVYFLYVRNLLFNTSDVTRTQLRSSVELNSSESYSDLLS